MEHNQGFGLFGFVFSKASAFIASFSFTFNQPKVLHSNTGNFNGFFQAMSVFVLKRRRSVVFACLFSFTSNALIFSRAAITAVNAEVEAVSCITPPPVDVDLKKKSGNSQHIYEPIHYAGFQFRTSRTTLPKSYLVRQGLMTINHQEWLERKCLQGNMHKNLAIANALSRALFWNRHPASFPPFFSPFKGGVSGKLE